MTFQPDRLFAAFARAGLLDDAAYQPRFGPRKRFRIGFVQADQLLADYQVVGPDVLIEYQTVDCPDLVVDQEVEIAGAAYRVAQPPVKTGDGFFTLAKLVPA